MPLNFGLAYGTRLGRNALSKKQFSIMEPFQLTLSPTDSADVRRLAQRLGKTETELLHEAVAALMQQASLQNWKTALSRIEGMWADHPDVPNISELRAGWQERGQQLTGSGDE